MAAGWPFFKTTLDNMEMVLAKTDLAIARRYAGLVEDRALSESIFGTISEGWALTRDSLLDATGQSRLSAHSPALDASIRLRLPCLEPPKLLHVDLIRSRRVCDSAAQVVNGLPLTIPPSDTDPKNNNNNQ